MQSRTTNKGFSATNQEQVWKKNDQRAQKNGSHSNIYWVRVIVCSRRNSPRTKMVLRNRTSGSVRTSTWANGKITKNTGSASSTSRMETSMRAAGVITSVMARVLSGSPIPRTNSEESILEIGKMTRKKVEEQCSSKREIVMMGCGWTASLMDREG